MKFVVIGRVEPERSGVTFLPIQTRDVKGGGMVKVVCDSSQLTVIVQDVPTITEPRSAFEFASNFADIWVESLGFVLGTGWRVQMVQVITEQDESHTFGVRPGYLHLLDDPEKMDEQATRIFNQVEELSGRDVFFRYAVSDYIRAMNEIDDCGHYCFRAIESVKNGISQSKSKKARWEEMHAALETEAEEITRIVSHFATPIRHGNWSEIEAPNDKQLYEMRILTRDILVKYMKYKQPEEE